MELVGSGFGDGVHDCAAELSDSALKLFLVRRRNSPIESR